MLKNPKLNIQTVFIICILSFMALLAFIPLYWMVITALTEPSLTMEFPPEIIPKKIVFTNFAELFQRKIIFRWTFNSFFVTGLVTVLQIFFCSLAGYSLAKKRFPGANIIFLIYIASMMIPAQVTLVPLYILISKFNMINTFYGLIFPGLAAPFGVFLMRQFMISIPNDIIDAAKIDGANEFQTYTKVILPMSKPALAVLGIFTFVKEWNKFLWPLIVTNTNDMKTLQAGLALLQEEVPLKYSYLMAGATYSAIPMIIIFLVFQKYFLRGITVGSIK